MKIKQSLYIPGFSDIVHILEDRTIVTYGYYGVRIPQTINTESIAEDQFKGLKDWLKDGGQEKFGIIIPIE